MKILISGIIIIFLWIFLRFAIKRSLLIVRLAKLAKELNCTFKIISHTFLFPFNSLDNYDFLIETKSTVYRIKLLGLLRKYCDIHFWNWQEYSVCKYYSYKEFVDAKPLSQRNARIRHLGKLNCQKDNHGSDYKQEVAIYLLSPANKLLRLTQTVGTTTVSIAPGDKIGNVLFMDREYLWWYLKNDGKDDL